MPKSSARIITSSFSRISPPYLTKIKASGAEVVYAGDWIPEAGNLLKPARQMKAIKGSFGGSSLDWDRILNLVSAKKVNLGRLMSPIPPLEEAEKDFETVRRTEVLKVILRP